MSLPMQEAKYFARACGAAQFEESGNGNMQIAVPFEILEEGFEGEVITWFATLHGTADKKGKTGKERVVESLVYMGFEGDDLTALMEISDEEARALMPESVELVCAPDVYDGVERLKVKWVNRPGAGRAGFKKPLAKEEMRSFAAQMRSSLKDARGGKRPAAPSSAGTHRTAAPAGNSKRPSQPQTAPVPEDDIPF
jgi:hypothetical protein